jgi:hypothetical protein
MTDKDREEMVAVQEFMIKNPSVGIKTVLKEVLGVEKAADLPEWAVVELCDFRYSTFSGELEMFIEDMVYLAKRK